LISPGAWLERGRYSDFRGHRIFLVEEGDGPPLTLVHGFPTSSWDWCKVWPELTRRFRCVAIDMLGFGFSDKPRVHDYSLFEQTDLHEAVLEKLGIAETHVLAHDYGDTVAQEWMARADEGTVRVRPLSVCMLNGGILFGTHRPRLMQSLLLSPLGPVVSSLSSYRTFQRNFPPIFGKDTQPPEDELRAYWECLAHNDGHRVLHRIIRYLHERRDNAPRWKPTLSVSSVPLRFVAGADDPISGRHMAEAFMELGERQDCVIMEDVGHYPQMEAPEPTLRHVLEFIEPRLQ